MATITRESRVTTSKIVPITKNTIGPIEDGIPVPSFPKNAKRGESKWPLAKLKINQSFTVPEKMAQAVRSAVSVFMKKPENARKYLITRTEGDRVRIWRIK